MKRLHRLWPACLWMLAASTAWAIMLDVPMDQLVASSSSVVRGQVTGLHSHWTSDHTNIVTDVTFRVDEDWTGAIQAGTSLTLQVLGGEVGEIGQRTEHQPVFTKDQYAVLFLAESPSARLVINYDAQGAYTVEGDKAIGAKGQIMPVSTLKATVGSMKSLRKR
jgi:hypothetical protein